MWKTIKQYLIRLRVWNDIAKDLTELVDPVSNLFLVYYPVSTAPVPEESVCLLYTHCWIVSSSLSVGSFMQGNMRRTPPTQHLQQQPTCRVQSSATGNSSWVIHCDHIPFSFHTSLWGLVGSAAQKTQLSWRASFKWLKCKHLNVNCYCNRKLHTKVLLGTGGTWGKLNNMLGLPFDGFEDAVLRSTIVSLLYGNWKNNSVIITSFRRLAGSGPQWN